MSGQITGNQSGTQPYLRINWSVVQTDVANNRSRVRLELVLISDYNLNFSASKSGNLNGSSFTYRGGFSGTGSRTLNTREFWVGHNNDGTRTVNFSASFNIEVNWSGSRLNSLSVSGSATLPSIARQSTLSSASIAALQVGQANSVSLSINRHHSNYRHDLSLVTGNRTVASWSNVATPSSLTLSASQVNDMLGIMSSQTSRTFTLRISTYNGNTSNSSRIGSIATRNITVNVHSNVTPTISNFSITQNGNGHDADTGLYVQGITRVQASFSRGARGGASLSSSRIVVRRQGNHANRMVINDNSGTSGTLTSHGTYEAIAEVTDSRGRRTTSTQTFTVQEYSAPTIRFTADRRESNSNIVEGRREGGHTPLNGNNRLQVYIQRRSNGGSWSTVSGSNTSLENFTGDGFGANWNVSGNEDTQSYDYRLVARDDFGNEAIEERRVSTARVVFSINKNENVGIGKIPERGTLDVDGVAYFDGEIHVNGLIDAQGHLLINPQPSGDAEGSAIEIRSNDSTGHGYIEFMRNNGNRAGYVGFQSANNETFDVLTEGNSSDIRLRAGSGRVRFQGNDRVTRNGSAMEIISQNNLEIRVGENQDAMLIGSNINFEKNLNMRNNDISNQSDGRYKKNITDTEADSLQDIMSLRFTDFEYDDPDMENKGRCMGLIAQESRDLQGYDADTDRYTINSSKQLMKTTHALQQAYEKVLELEKRIEQLEAEKQRRRSNRFRHLSTLKTT